MKFGLTRWRPSAVSQWDPFEEISRTQERLNQLFEHFAPREEWLGEKTISPLMDVKEEGDKIIVKTDVPGVDKKDVEISVKDNVLEINAKCSKESDVEEEGYVRHERMYNSFHRAIMLPSFVTQEGAKAKLDDGVLTLTLPKSAIEEGHRIMIE
ncbi:MAG: Hsp20/alpha crystallin family protein [Methanosarcinaceae archaeon]|nr:Hsp20/alpha crystallin family protein [Methanosarcinaceae archaeon]